MSTHYEEINLNSIRTRSNYRQTFDEKKLKELAASIKEHGIIQPIVVRPVGNKYEIVAGECRARVARMSVRDYELFQPWKRTLKEKKNV